MAISRAKRFQAKKRRKQTNENGGRSRFKQGLYQPINENKYIDPQDNLMNKYPGTPFYRSGWELKFYRYCDLNDDIEYWSCEAFAIPYISPKDNRQHRYYPDVLVKFKNGKKLCIEIKPKSQWQDPINVAKWEAARKFCSVHGMEFVVMGADELGIK